MESDLAAMAAEQLEARAVHAVLHVGFLNSAMRRVLRDRNKRCGAVYYYLLGVVGYTLEEVQTLVFELHEHQVEDLALLGIENRDLKPELWERLIN